MTEKARSHLLIVGGILAAIVAAAGWKLWLGFSDGAGATAVRPRPAAKMASSGAAEAGEESAPHMPSPVFSNGEQRDFGREVPTVTLSEAELSQTSWQDPFAAKYWQSRGWGFDADSMQSGQLESSEATFCRRYRKLMLEFRLELPEEAAALHIRLLAEETRTRATVTIDQDSVVVATDGPDSERHIIKQKQLEGEPSSRRDGTLRLAATGNRLQILWGGRRLLTCNQPQGQSGRVLKITLVANRPGVRLADMRIEGEG
jgi:hypothetical protein